MKICTKCKRELPLDRFCKHNNGLNPSCKNCQSALKRQYYKANPDKKRESDKNYRRENIEKIKVQRKEYRIRTAEYKKITDAEYRKKNADKLTQYFKNHYLENREQKIKASKEYAKQNKIKRQSYLREYRQINKDELRIKTRVLKRANKEQYKIYGLNYLARKNNAKGEYTLEQWLTLCEFFNWTCPNCKRQFTSLQADHIIPLTWDETSNWITNIQPLCKSCNTGKGNHHATDYRENYVKLWAKEQVYFQKLGINLRVVNL